MPKDHIVSRDLSHTASGARGGGAERFKPNVAFLRKVAAGMVAARMGYTTRRGGYYYFVGGEKTAKAHLRAGYVKPWGGASLGRSAQVELTALGLETLAKALPPQPQSDEGK